MSESCKIDFGGETLIYHTGDGLLIPAGEASKHKPRAISGTVKLFMAEDC